MPVAGKTYSFSQSNVDKSPDKSGVYALLDDTEVIYFGSSTVSIRARLQRHFDGDEGGCTQKATYYKREACNNERARERELLQAYQAQNGLLPLCNDIIP